MNIKNNFKKIFAISLIAVSLILVNNESFASDNSVIYGGDRYETNYKVNLHCNLKDTDTVVFASGEKYPDALSGGNISYGENYPLILINKKGDNYKKSLQNYPNLKNIIIVGGEKTLSTKVENELKKKYTVKRISGNTRYSTSKEVYKYLNDKNNTRYKKIAVRGDSFADALSAVPFARKNGGVIILSDNNHEYFDYKVGGNVKGKSNNIIKGKDRYETSKKLVGNFKEDSLVVVEGNNFPDALSASEIAGKYDGNILLVEPKYDKESSDLMKNAKSTFFVGGKVKNYKKNYMHIENDNTLPVISAPIKAGTEDIDDFNNFTVEELRASRIRQYNDTDSLLKGINMALLEENTDRINVAVKNMEPWTNNSHPLLDELLRDTFFRTLYGCVDDNGNHGFNIQYKYFNNKKYLEIIINRDLYSYEKCNRMVKDLKMPGGIIDQLKNIDGDYNKVVYLLDHMAKKNCKYDYASYNTGVCPHNNPIDAHFGISQCAGYAAYIEYIAKEAGIDAQYTTDENIRANHAWVTFNIDGKKYGSDPVIVIKANKGIENENWLPEYKAMYFSPYNEFTETMRKYSKLS